MMGKLEAKLIFMKNQRHLSFNTYGRNFVELCKSASLCIAHGRMPGDRAGEFTCMSNTGQSVVHYLIVSISWFTNILDLEVTGRFESDHFPLEFTTQCNPPEC